MKTLLLLLALALTGCASPDYAKYVESNTAIETAKHQADAAKWRAMADIAGQGDATAKVAAVMAMAMGQGQAAAGNGLRAPEPNQALQWASILIPSLTQVAGMRYQYLSSTAQSNNAASVAISTNGTLLGIAGRIQAPGAITTNTLSGTGTLGSGAYSTADSHDTTAPFAVPVVIEPVVQVVPTVVPPVVVTPIVKP